MGSSSARSRADRHPQGTAVAAPAAEPSEDYADRLVAGDAALSGDAAGWLAALSPAERAALEDYQGLDYEPINAFLRHGLIDPALGESRLRALVARLDSALGIASLKRSVIAYRGVDGAEAFLGPLTAGNLVGRSFTDDGYHSTTLDRSFAAHMGTAVFRYRIPRGTRAAYLGDNVRTAVQEHELLLARGARYRITGVRKKAGVTYIDAEITR